MATELRRVSLGILGDGDVSPQLVCDVLNDQFSLGAEDEDGYFAASNKYELQILFPAHEVLTTKAVHNVWQWAIRCDLPYSVYTNGTENAFSKDIVRDCESENDIHEAKFPDHVLIDDLAVADNPMLLLVSKDGEFTGHTEQCAAMALRAGIPCYDLSRALLEITWHHLPNEEEPEETALEVEEDGQTAIPLSLVDAGPDLPLTAHDVATINSTLHRVETVLDCLDTLSKDNGGQLRKAVIEARALLLPKPEPAPKGAKTKLVIFNPQTNSWEPAGRGRPPKDAQTMRVPA